MDEAEAMTAKNDIISMKHFVIVAACKKSSCARLKLFIKEKPNTAIATHLYY